jgi:hypothetical protein
MRAVPLTAATRIRRNTDVIAAGVAHETVLLDPADWTYIHMNETAARIWEALDEPRSIGTIVDAFLRDYDVDRATCEREVSHFVDEMSRRNLIVIDAA